MNGKQVLVVAVNYTPTHDQAPSSRALYLFEEIRKRFPGACIMMRDDGRGVEMDGLCLVKPIVPVRGGMKFAKGLLFRLQALPCVLGFILKNNVGVVVIRGYDIAFYLPFLKLMGLKVIYDFHGLVAEGHADEGRYLRSLFSRHFEVLMLKLSDKVLVVSEGIRRQFPWLAEKCLYLPNGMDLEKMEMARGDVECLPGDKKSLCFIGNWEPFMRVEDMCEAMRYLEGCEGFIIGWGKDADNYVKKYEGLSNLTFTGRLSPEEAYAILKKCNVCVLPYAGDYKYSRIPGYFCTRKALEYTVAGKPIVVADIPGKEERLADGHNCLFYKPGDPKDLADKVMALLNDGPLYEKLRSNNEARAPYFAWGRVVESSGLPEEIASMLSRR
jgi:glycosyltransferase involved in cell wall biosynthesis